MLSHDFKYSKIALPTGMCYLMEHVDDDFSLDSWQLFLGMAFRLQRETTGVADHHCPEWFIFLPLWLCGHAGVSHGYSLPGWAFKW